MFVCVRVRLFVRLVDRVDSYMAPFLDSVWENCRFELRIRCKAATPATEFEYIRSKPIVLFVYPCPCSVFCLFG